MSEHGDKHRSSDMKAKIAHYCRKSDGQVDASDYHIPGPPAGSGQTYVEKMKNPRAFKRGGAVGKSAGGATSDDDSDDPNAYHKGEFDAWTAHKRGGKVAGGKAHKHAGRKSRDAGGAMTAGVPTQRFNFDNSQQSKFLNLKSGGKADHWIAGAVKHPGALHRELGVPEGKKIPEKKLEKAEHSKNPVERKRANLAETLKGLHRKDGGKAMAEETGTRPVGGRIAKASGGSAKGKTNVAIIIQQPPAKPDMPMGGPPGMAGPVVPPMPPKPPMGAPPPGGMPPGAGGPPPGPMPPPGVMRADGGKVYPKMDHAAGGGLGRMEKAKKYGP